MYSSWTFLSLFSIQCDTIFSVRKKKKRFKKKFNPGKAKTIWASPTQWVWGFSYAYGNMESNKTALGSKNKSTSKSASGNEDKMIVNFCYIMMMVKYDESNSDKISISANL